MIIAQITDMHVVEEGVLCGGSIPTNDMLRSAVYRINNLDPPVDLVLATGDLVEHGKREAEYHVLKSILCELSAPVFVIPGNHDQRDMIRKVFPENDHYPRGNGPLNYVIDTPLLSLIGLDTSVPGSPEGKMDYQGLAWLKAALTSRLNRPTLIFMHHPPFRTGIWWMDAVGLFGGKNMAERVSQFDNIKRIICGHIHRSISANWAGTTVSVAPSTAHQLVLDLSDNHFLEMSYEPPGFDLHVWDGETIISHNCPVKAEIPFIPSDHADVHSLPKMRRYFEEAARRMMDAGECDVALPNHSGSNSF